MLKNIRNYFLIISALLAFNCMTKKQSIVPLEFKLDYSNLIYKSEKSDSSDCYIIGIESEHISGGCESSFSEKGYYLMEERRKEVYKNILLTLEQLNRNCGLDFVGLESLEVGDSSIEGKSRYPSEIPEEELDSILRGTNYLPGFMIKETFGDKILTFGISNKTLQRKHRKINEETSKIEREFRDRGMMIYGKEGYLVWNSEIKEEFLDRSACSLMAEYQYQNAKKEMVIEEREDSSMTFLLEKMKKRNKHLAAFVMGSGHTKNLKELLNKMKISFCILKPKGYRYEKPKKE